MTPIRSLLLLSDPSFLFIDIAPESGLLIDQSLLPHSHNLVIFKQSSFEALSGDVYLSLSILNPVLPLPPVIAAVHPVHLPEPISEVCLVVSLIDVATGPCKHPVTPFLVVSVAAIVSVAVTHSLLPNSLAVPKTVDEVTLKVAPVLPIILTINRRLTIQIATLVHVPIRKTFNPFSMFETLLELSLIGVAIEPSMHSIALWLAKSPLSFVGVSFMTPPHTRTMLKTVHPLSIIIFSIWPSVATDTIRLAALVLSLVKASIWKSFSPITFLLVF